MEHTTEPKSNGDVKPVTTRASISREAVLRLAPMMAVNDIRYYLNGLHIRSAAPKPGVYIEATDGNMLGVIYEPDGELQCDDPKAGVIINVSRELIAACRKRIAGVKSDVPRVLVHARRVSVAANHEAAAGPLEWFVQPGNSIVEGKYPDTVGIMPRWKRLMPEINESINAKLLVKILAAASTIPAKFGKDAGATATRFWSDVSNPSGPVVVQFQRIPNMVALIMPMHEGCSTEDWINRLVDQMPAAPVKKEG